MRPRLFLALLLAALLPAAACSTTGETTDPEERVVEMHLQNAQTYYWAGPTHASRAYQQASKALELDPENVKGRFLRAMSLIQMGGEHPRIRGAASVEVAEKELVDLKKDDTTYGWKIDLGIGWARSELAKLYQARAERLEARIRAATEHDDVAPLRKDRREALRRRDELFLSSNEICESVLERGEPGADENFVVLLALNVNYTYLGDRKKALSYTERAAEVAARMRPVWERWLDNPTTSPDQYQEALAKLRSASAKEVRAREACADHLYHLGRYDEAAAHLDRAVELDARRLESRLLRAQVNVRRHEFEQARTDLLRYFALSEEDASSPTAQEAAMLLQRCEDQLAMNEESEREEEQGEG